MTHKAWLRRLLLRPELASIGGLAIAFTAFSLATPLFLTKANFVSFSGLAAQFASWPLASRS